MNTVDSRIEKKIVIENEYLPLALELLRQSPYPFYEAFPARRINNLYYDTLEDSCLKKHIHGSLIREKFRVRWYGEDTLNLQQPFFEIKTKRGSVVSKSRWDLVKDRIEQFYDSQNLPHLFIERNAAAASVQDLCRGLEYKVTNSYHRQYFFSPSLNTRLTIDTDLSFSTTAFNQIQFNSTIIELKAPLTVEGIPWSELFRSFPWRVVKNSKYILGRQLLEG